jgi:foldase protein PrsA
LPSDEKKDQAASADEKPRVKKMAEAKTTDKPDAKADAATKEKPDVATHEKADVAVPVTQSMSSAADDGASEEVPTPAALKRAERRNLKSTAIKVTAAVVALVAVVVVVFGVLIYAYKSESPVVAAVAQVIPYPVERVNGHLVSYSDYLFEVDANKRAYQNNAKLNGQPAVDFKSADGKKLVTQIKQHSLEKLQGDALVVQLAKQKKVKVTDKEVNDLINQLYTRYGGKDTLLKTLKDIYGWDLNDLKQVVRKQLLAKNLEEKITSDPAVDAAAKSKAQGVLKQVKDGGDFTEVAKKNSQASDAASGGDLGFFTKGQLPDNLQAAAEALQPGQVSDVVKTDYGYEVIKVVEKKDDGSIHAQHILIKTVDFNEYFQGEQKKAKINTYIKV